MQTGETINIPYIKKTIEKCCRSGSGCESCEGKNCLIGFAKIVSNYADQKKMLAIPGGLNLVPKQDFKVYEVDDIACALAVISLECKNCMDNHDDNCIINIMRSSLEIALLGEHVKFNGGAFTYIISLTQIKPELGNKVMEFYNMLKNDQCLWFGYMWKEDVMDGTGIYVYEDGRIITGEFKNNEFPK